MHDARTRQAIDALAELLLTGPQPPVQIDAQPAPEPDLEQASCAPAESSTSGGPQLRIADDPAPPAVVEAVLLGHLPGFASPWVSQYAADLAQRHQGAALLRLAESTVQVELFDVNPDLNREFDRQPDTNPLGEASDEPAGADELVETLHDVGSAVGAYLLLIDRPSDPVQRQRLLSIDHWTVLTSANDAAVVGCYRMLKSLLVGTDRHPRISLMFMGCNDAEAASAVERINRAAAEFLDAPIEMCGVRRRMRPAPRQHAGRFAAPSHEKLWAAVTETILPDITAPSPAAAADPEPIFTLDPQLDSPDAAPPKPDAECLGSAETEASGSPAPTTRSAPPAVRESAPPPPPTPAPEPEPEPEPESDDAENDTSSLARHIPGLTPLAARSPRHPQVELAVDAAGRLHLLLQTFGSGGGSGGGDDTTAALATLNATRSWLTEHRQLIALTAPDRRLDLDQSPQAHLLTDQPAAAAEFLFAAPPDQRPFRLHLLTQVTVAGRTAWACAPIG
jgi:hypothetical protein